MLTTGDLSVILSNFPEQMPVTVLFDRKTLIWDETGDRISGEITGYFDIKTVEEEQEFVCGKGFLPIAALYIGADTSSFSTE